MDTVLGTFFVAVVAAYLPMLAIQTAWRKIRRKCDVIDSVEHMT